MMGDSVEVAGKTKHVTSYLRDFLFDDFEGDAKGLSLSGGEQNRLLAKIFAQPHNFLVLDEPTNDLDIETIDLLQEVVADYDGTILIVSHDRIFWTGLSPPSVLAFEGEERLSRMLAVIMIIWQGAPKSERRMLNPEKSVAEGEAKGPQ